ncbi:hypothetical protein CR513_49194, partial [Mucuna pruriens]
MFPVLMGRIHLTDYFRLKHSVTFTPLSRILDCRLFPFTWTVVLMLGFNGFTFHYNVVVLWRPYMKLQTFKLDHLDDFVGPLGCENLWFITFSLEFIDLLDQVTGTNGPTIISSASTSTLPPLLPIPPLPIKCLSSAKHCDNREKGLCYNCNEKFESLPTDVGVNICSSLVEDDDFDESAATATEDAPSVDVSEDISSLHALFS